MVSPSPSSAIDSVGDNKLKVPFKVEASFGEFMLWVSLLYSSVVNCHPEPVDHPSALFSKSSSQRMISSRLEALVWLLDWVYVYSLPSFIMVGFVSALIPADSRENNMLKISTVLIMVKFTNCFIFPASCSCYLL